MISITVNGKQEAIDRRMSVLEFLERRQVNPQIVAVERNGEIVRRTSLSNVVLDEGDRLEIVRMVGGGADERR